MQHSDVLLGLKFLGEYGGIINENNRHCKLKGDVGQLVSVVNITTHYNCIGFIETLGLNPASGSVHILY